ncbi:MAG: EcsC family protein [Alphaproteobacteria bacterium]|nr:EcsC family protein [Alphaproteobacteria bacterium]
MPSPLQELIDALGDRLDDGLLPAVYQAASLETAAIRAELDRDGLHRWDPQTGRHPDRMLLDESASQLTRRASRLAAARGAAGSFGGLLSVPPEVAAALVQSLRLAQRLAVVYGFDPETDHGRILLARALAEGFEVELPAEGAVGLRIRELPEVIRSRLPAREDATLRDRGRKLAGAAAKQALALVGKRVGRLIPGFGTTIGAIGARRALLGQGERMQKVYGRAFQGDLVASDDVLDVVEIDGAG